MNDGRPHASGWNRPIPSIWKWLGNATRLSHNLRQPTPRCLFLPAPYGDGVHSFERLRSPTAMDTSDCYLIGASVEIEVNGFQTKLSSSWGPSSLTITRRSNSSRS